MSKKINTHTFVERAIKIHNDVYDYSTTNYKKAVEKVSIICKKHGIFYTTPNSHLNGRGCKKCGLSKMSNLKSHDIEKFVKLANKTHDCKYSYEKAVYTNNSCKIIITCKIHGDFIQQAASHLSGCGCPKCAKIERGMFKRNSTANFISKAIVKHGKRYDYSKVHYVTAKEKIIIVCPQHGEFKQTPDNHLSGNGCKQCSRKNSNYMSFGKSRFTNTNEKAYLYLIGLHSKNENFLKIGITKNSVARRFSQKLPYYVEPIFELEGNPSSVWDAELKIKKLYKEFSYTPRENFSGKSECFSFDAAGYLIQLMRLLEVSDDLHLNLAKPIPV